MNHDQDENHSVMSKMTSLDTKVAECIASSTSGERLSSSMAETIINQRCDELKRNILESQDKAIEKLTSDLEAKFEGSRVGNMTSEINHRCEKLITDRIIFLEKS